MNTNFRIFPGMSHERWISLARQAASEPKPRQAAAFGELYALATSYGKALLRKKFSKLHVEDIEDLVCQKFLDKADSIITADSPKSYFATVVINAAKDFVRPCKWYQSSPASPQQVQDADLDSANATLTEIPILEAIDGPRLLELLSSDEYDVLCLLVDGYSSEEIAKRLGKSVGNIYKIKSRALEKLAEQSLTAQNSASMSECGSLDRQGGK